MEVHRSWKSLPVEILHEIFCLLDNQYHVTHVCKAWLIPAKFELYSNVMFKTLPQLLKFYNTVEHNSHLGNIVKKLDHDFSKFLIGLNEGSRQSTATEITNLSKNLLSSYLPNLEEICDSIGEDPGFGVRSYSLILNALKNAHLKHLRKLYSPLCLSEYELETYMACALLTKDRLENLEINEDLESRRLYDILYQFDKVKELVMASVKGLKSIEHIVAACKSLRTLQIDFYNRDGEHNSIEAISKFTPAYNIKSLEIHLADPNDAQIFFYIMHKFPNLDYILLDFCGRVPFDREMFTRLLKFSSNIEHFHSAGLAMDHDQTVEAMGEFYNATSQVGIDTVDLDFSDSPWIKEKLLFRFDRRKSVEGTRVDLRYSLSNLDRKYIEYLKKNGKYIGTLSLMLLQTKDAPRSVKCELPESFLNHAFSLCPNLHTLGFINCVLKRLKYTSINLQKSHLIKDLYFGNCIIYPGVLEQLSLLLPKIKRLTFTDELIYRNSEKEPPGLGPLYDNSKIEIVMWATEIDTVAFGENYYDKIVHLKVFALTDRNYYYYRFEKDIEASNEEEYTIENYHKHVHICCQNKPKFVFYST